jgi:hypothetical protein
MLVPDAGHGLNPTKPVWIGQSIAGGWEKTGKRFFLKKEAKTF